VEDLAQGYFSDFDLMVIVENAALAEDDALWPKVASEAGRISGRSPVTLLVHDIKHFNQEVRTGQYLFSDVVNEGVVLFDSKRFSLARPQAQTPEERLELRRQNFSYWFPCVASSTRTRAAASLATARRPAPPTSQHEHSDRDEERRRAAESACRRSRTAAPGLVFRRRGQRLIALGGKVVRQRRTGCGDFRRAGRIRVADRGNVVGGELAVFEAAE
jgi:hypothetical protein